MTRVTFTVPAGETHTPRGTFPSRFAPGAFDSQIGKEVPFPADGRRAGRGRLVAAVIAPGGEYADLTFDVGYREGR